MSKKTVPQSDILYNIGERIKEYMDYANMTAKDLADAVGITATSISLIVNAKNAPRVETLHQIALALGIEDWQLFTNKNLVEDSPKTKCKELPSSSILCPHCGKPINIKVEANDGTKECIND